VTVIGMALMIPADLGFEVWITTRPVTGRGRGGRCQVQDRQLGQSRRVLGMRNGVQPSMSEGERGGRHANVTQVGAQLGATVEFIPVMNAEELQRGLAEVAKG